MPKLTNIELSFERSIKKADYENAKFGARFSLLIDEGEDAKEIAELYGRQIVRFVEDKLGIRSEIEVPTAKATVKAVEALDGGTANTTVKPDPVVETPPKKGPGRPKAEKPAPAAEAATVATSDRATSGTGGTAGGATTVTVTGGGGITDKQLSEAITATVGITKDPMAARQLVQTFFDETPPDKVWGSREIHQSRRQEFLNKLEAMKAAAKGASDVSEI